MHTNFYAHVTGHSAQRRAMISGALPTLPLELALAAPPATWPVDTADICYVCKFHRYAIPKVAAAAHSRLSNRTRASVTQLTSSPSHDLCSASEQQLSQQQHQQHHASYHGQWHVLTQQCLR